jgi:hypothetical protein
VYRVAWLLAQSFECIAFLGECCYLRVKDWHIMPSLRCVEGKKWLWENDSSLTWLHKCVEAFKQKYLLFLLHFNSIWILSMPFQKCAYIKFHEKSIQSELSCSMWTDAEIDTMKLIVNFRNFANAPKKDCEDFLTYGLFTDRFYIVAWYGDQPVTNQWRMWTWNV